MAKWVNEQLQELLHQINEVPFTDDREKRQLTILMNGFAQINSMAMDKAATKTREQMSGWNLEEAENKAKSKAKKDSEFDDSSNDELTRLRPIR